ncbi:hypothetical protein [Nocardia grenadensis]|uniref:hypothetical protein n=1 Tax=Nocardia grenadensis TaxID=931537 RepID=UPI0007A3C626|nr:hypothetical protein [Nocardia grenadensis]
MTHTVDRDELYDRVTEEYEVPRGVSLEDADAVTDSVMEVVFKHLREAGVMMPEKQYQRLYTLAHPSEL